MKRNVNKRLLAAAEAARNIQEGNNINYNKKRKQQEEEEEEEEEVDNITNSKSEEEEQSENENSENDQENDDESSEEDEEAPSKYPEWEGWRKGTLEEEKPSENKLIYKYNRSGIKQKLEDISLESKLGDDYDWVELLTVTVPAADVNPMDDLQRELAFYKNTQGACGNALQLIKQNGISYKRPEDYFAEMLKSDAHMEKVRRRLLEQRRRIEIVEERKKSKEVRLFGKQKAIEEKKQKDKERKTELEKIKKWRKEKVRGDTKDDFQVALEQWDTNKPATTEQKTDQSAKRKRDDLPKKGSKRMLKDQKYGSGGKKRLKKRNDTESYSDTSGFNLRKNKSLDTDLSRKIRNKGKTKKDNRFGKKRREKMRKL